MDTETRLPPLPSLTMIKTEPPPTPQPPPQPSPQPPPQPTEPTNMAPAPKKKGTGAQPPIANRSSSETKIGEIKRKRRRRRHRSYGLYVHRVLKQVHSDLSVSTRAIAVMDSLVSDVFERLAAEASRLVAYGGRGATLGVREVRTAVRLLVPGELGRHAMNEGARAVDKYSNSE